MVNPTRSLHFLSYKNRVGAGVGEGEGAGAGEGGRGERAHTTAPAADVRSVGARQRPKRNLGGWCKLVKVLAPVRQFGKSLAR